jgi:uncharacterized membrane protein
MDVAPAPPKKPRRWRPRWKEVETPPTKKMRLLFVLGPIGLTLVLFGLVWILASPEKAREVTVAATASIFVLGTAVVLGPAALGDTIRELSTWDLALIVIYLTCVTAFFFSYNLDLLHRVPVIGAPLRRARINAVRTLRERPWIRRWATIGVGLFVFLPLPGSGSLGGSLVGRLLGLKRITCFLTVSTAGLVVCLIYAVFGSTAASWAERHEVPLPWRIAILVALGVGLFFLSRWVSKMLKMPVKPDSPAAT